MEYIATFFTHFGAIKFGRLLDHKKIEHHMMPVPRKLSSSCGTCVRFKGELFCNIGEDEEIEGLYLVREDGYEMVLIKE